MAGTAAARRLATLSRRLAELDQVVVAAVGAAVVDALEQQVNADTHGGSMSGMNKGRYQLKLKVSPLNNPAGVRIWPAARQSGMWSIMESGARAHDVAARPRRKRKSKGKAAKASSRARAMNPGGKGFRVGPFHNTGGSRGHRTWSRGVDKGMAAGLDAAADLLRKAVTGG